MLTVGQRRLRQGEIWVGALLDLSPKHSLSERQRVWVRLNESSVRLAPIRTGRVCVASSLSIRSRRMLGSHRRTLWRIVAALHCRHFGCPAGQACRVHRTDQYRPSASQPRAMVICRACAATRSRTVTTYRGDQPGFVQLAAPRLPRPKALQVSLEQKISLTRACQHQYKCLN